MSAITEALASVSGMSAYTLADMAMTTCPDSLDSAGAEFLTAVRSDVVEQLRYLVDTAAPEDDPIDPAELAELGRQHDVLTEVADGAPSIYTFQKFRQFTDLAAWQEDISDYADGETDMEKMAGIALYMIAERLVSALLDYVADFESSEDED